MGEITASKGLKLEPDTTPLSGSMTEDAELIDDVLYTAATGDYWYYHYCYGLDLGSSQLVSKLICRAAVSHTPTGWYSSAHDSVTVYKSDDGSAWSEVETFDGPPIVHSAYLEAAFELELSSPQTARYFKVRNAESSSTLATSPGGASLMVSEIEAYVSSTQTQLEDASLDLSVYYQSREDLASLLRAHDGIELHDLAAKLESAGWSIEDLAGFLSAYYQEMEDTGMDLIAWGTHYHDLKSFVAAYFQQLVGDMKAGLETWATRYDDAVMDLEASAIRYNDAITGLIAYGQEIGDFGAGLQAALDSLYDFGAVLAATDGSVLKNLGVFLYATDGEVKHDAALILGVVSETPAFRTVTAQRVASIVHEVI